MSGGGICGVEQGFVGARDAVNFLLPEFNMFSAAQLIKADLLNYLKQKNLCLYLFDLG